jgi:hypothetical protein
MLLVKSLNLNFILEGGIIARADVKELPIVASTTPLYTMLNIFQTGRSHMAGVMDPISPNKTIGIITLEDIIEELIQEEIEDEMDIWRREHIRVRKSPSRRTSFEGSEGGHRHHHHHIHRSKSGASVSKKERREQRRRTRRGREMALGVESDSGILSDSGREGGGGGMGGDESGFDESDRESVSTTGGGHHHHHHHHHASSRGGRPGQFSGSISDAEIVLHHSQKRSVGFGSDSSSPQQSPSYSSTPHLHPQSASKESRQRLLSASTPDVDKDNDASSSPSRPNSFDDRRISTATDDSEMVQLDI